MNLLAIDTSTSRASLALRFQGQLLTSEEVSTRQHARVLLVMIEALLAEAGAGFDALDGIVFGEGPGSFTGIRIACSVAKGLAYAHDLPLFPVGGLQAIAYDVRRFEKPVLAVLDARMNQLYWSFGADTKVVVSAPCDVHVPKRAEIILAGTGFEPYLNQLPEVLREAIVSQHNVFPDASTMIEIVELGGVEAVSAEKAMPVYVRDQVTGGVHG
ncbi:MAG: tRNA (adenosine(37)-N6)-threonylcarbamoyltransferase complex dimerization subunit type 1 TsaB [Legionellaceae bacterium]|nr:tRNA (adenosine(37)-N6)-threonylcarbamoyltransferase complex dimerization subunit type 1 TsaB [Legionellaceae bacterium]